MDSSRARRGSATRERITQPIPIGRFDTGRRQIIALIRKPTGQANRSATVRNLRVRPFPRTFWHCCFLYRRRYNFRCKGSSQKPTLLWTRLQPPRIDALAARQLLVNGNLPSRFWPTEPFGLGLDSFVLEEVNWWNETSQCPSFLFVQRYIRAASRYSA